MKNLKLLSLIFCSFLTSCALSPSRMSSDFELKKVETITLENGLTILVVNDSTLPRFGMSLMIKSGGLDEAIQNQGVSYLTALALDQGTTKRSALQVSEEFGMLGTEFSQSPGVEFTTFSAATISPKADEMLRIFSEVVLSPAFEEKQVRRLKSEILAGLNKESDNPSGFASKVSSQFVFGADHPYGASLMGTQESLSKLTRQNIIDFYQQHYIPDNAILSIYGKVSPELLTSAKIIFSGWQAGKRSQLVKPVEVNLQERKVLVVNKPGLKQAQIRISLLGVPRSSNRFLPLRIGNMVLGGAFASRLNQKVRDDLGLTYSIGSGFSHYKYAGLFQISTFTRYEKLTETVSAAEVVLNDFVVNGITQKELDGAKAVLIGQFPMALETVDQYVFNLMVLRYYGIGDEYLQNYIKNVNRISLSEVNKAIVDTLANTGSRVVIYGDIKQMQNKTSIWPNVEVRSYKDIK